MTGAEVGLALTGLALTIGGGVLGMRLKPIENNVSDLKDALDELKDDAKEDKKAIEDRLAGIERQYVSRMELDGAIKTICEHFDRGADRTEASLKSMSEKVDHIAERLNRVESTR